MTRAAELTYLAVDLGASSGRVLAVSFGQSLNLDVVHRFANRPQQIGGGLYWNHLQLWEEIQSGLEHAAKRQSEVRSVGVDTWGVDFLLLDEADMPIGPGFCYRDTRNASMMERAFERLPRREIFAESGIQFMQINSLYQLLAYRLLQPRLLDCTRRFLMVPDFLHWLLSGQMVNEATDASTTQMLRPGEQVWSSRICDAMDFDRSWFLAPTQPATVLGPLTDAVRRRTGLPAIDVVVPASHDTASAVLAVPVDAFAESSPRWGYISSGTWSLMGVERDRPVLSDDCLRLNFTNEAGPLGSVRLLKNIAGLWPLQQYREQLVRRGDDRSWDALIESAGSAAPLRRLIDLDNPRLINPPDMAAAIGSLMTEAGIDPPSDSAEMTRCLLESLAMRYRVCLDSLEELLGYRLERLFVMGGGVQNRLLCQMTADATGREVVAGHAEATAVGNAVAQAVGVGRFATIREARGWLQRVLPCETYHPQRTADWDRAYEWYSARYLT